MNPAILSNVETGHEEAENLHLEDQVVELVQEKAAVEFDQVLTRGKQIAEEFFRASIYVPPPCDTAYCSPCCLP